MSVTLRHPDGLVHVEQLKAGKNKISVELLNQKLFMPVGTWQTSYPVDLIERIMDIKGPNYVCDEIMRDEDPMYTQHRLKYDILSYVGEDSFDSKRILDFGCGCGSSTAVLARMFPNTEIVGVELEDKFLSIARLRAKYYEFDNVSFTLSPDGYSLPFDLGDFDYAILSAVYEHLLPDERRTLLPKIWSHIKLGGILFISQTPNRYFPVESHTTGLPLINHLPGKVALHIARKFSRRVGPDESWETLLRRGIRGGTVKEIMQILNTTSEKPILCNPERLGIKNRVDLWYQTSSHARLSTLKKSLLYCLKTLGLIAGTTVIHSLSLTIKKSQLKRQQEEIKRA